MPIGISLVREEFDCQECLECITVFIPVWNQSGFFISESLIVSCMPDNVDIEENNIPIQFQERKFTANVEMIDKYTGCVFLSLIGKIELEIETLPFFLNNSSILSSNSRVYLSYYDREEYETVITDIEGMRTTNSSLDKRQYVKLSLVDVAESVLGAPVWSVEQKSIIGIVCAINNQEDYKRSGYKLLVVPAYTIQESVQSIEQSVPSSLELAATAVSNDTIERVFIMSETAYAEANPYQSAFVSSEIADRYLLQLNNCRRNALIKWFSVRSDCLRFIVENSSGVIHRVGATCVLPLTQHAYQQYRNGKKREFDIEKDDIVTDSSAKITYLCFQSFVYTGKSLRNIFSVLKNAILSHALSLASLSKEIYCVAEIGTRAGDRVSKLFDHGTFIGFSLDKRPLIEWHFNHAEIEKIKKEVDRDE